MVYRLTSSKAVIAKVIADLDLTENDLRISDIQSWIGEAVEKIGAIHTLNTKVSGEHGEPLVRLKDYQASLPCDLHGLHQVAYSGDECGEWKAMRLSTGTMTRGDIKDDWDDLQYSLKPGYINCNVRDGYLKLSYNAIPRDSFGYVMVPDLASVFEAIYWYIAVKLMYPEYYKGRMRQDIYYNMRNSWNFYRKQAYGELLTPNHDGMESIKNTWNKLYPEQDDHRLFYDTTGERQHIYNEDR
jgi:hypothetical protein